MPCFFQRAHGRGLWRLVRVMVMGMLAACISPLCAQQDGTERWSFRGDRNSRFDSSPAIGADGTLYVGVRIDTSSESGMLLAIDREGNEKWVFPTPNGGIDSSPAIGSDGTLYVGCTDGNLYAVNPVTGTEIWRFSVSPGHVIFGSPVIGPDDTIYFGTCNGNLDGSVSEFYALTRNRVVRWKKTAADWIEVAPAIGPDGTIYYVSWDGFVYAVGSDGVDKWRFSTGARVLGAPAIGVDGTIYVGTDVALWAITPQGARRWSFTVAGASSPALAADGTVYFGAFDANFYALRPQDGAIRWIHGVDRSIQTTPLVRADGTVIFGADDGKVRGLNPDGSKKWEFVAEGPVRSSPVVAPQDGRIYFGSQGSRFYALHGSGAPVSEYSSWPMFNRGVFHRGRAEKRLTNSRLVNISTLGDYAPDRPLIVGFVARGAQTKNYLVRAAGPALSMFGVPQPLGDPTILLRIPGVFDLTNDNWEDGVSPSFMASTGAFAFPEGSRDAALIAPLAPGDYTARAGSADGGSGAALIEVYDADLRVSGTSLVNLSTRGRVGAGPNILSAGVVVQGTEPIRLLIRVVGPGLAPFNVPGFVARPTMAVFSGGGEVLRNSGWTAGGKKGDLAAAASLAGAFALSEFNQDCAAIVTLNPGNHTVQAAGIDNTTGEALVEVYVVP